MDCQTSQKGGWRLGVFDGYCLIFVSVHMSHLEFVEEDSADGRASSEEVSGGSK